MKLNKYNNTKCEYDGITFDSKREMARYIFLLDCQSQNLISGLTVHPKWEIIPAIRETIVKQYKKGEKTVTKTKQLPITYTADFSYYKNGEHVVEDVKISKSLLPKEFLLKKKLMYWKFRIDIKLVFKPTEEI